MNELLLKQIIRQNKQIEDCFERLTEKKEDYELICISIINLLRTLIEHLASYHYGMTKKIEFVLDKESLREVVSFMKKKENNIFFLEIVHRFLQASSSHYVIDEISAPRLLLKYIPYLNEAKKWALSTYQIDILKNLKNISNIQSNEMLDYYCAILERLIQHDACGFKDNKERYYVYKSIPIYVKNTIIFETTIGIASNYASKFNRFIVYSSFFIDERYSIKINYDEDCINVNGNLIPIKIVTSYSISIRPCEFANFAKLLCMESIVQSNLNEYINLMDFMTKENKGLHNIVLSSNEEFLQIKEKILIKTSKAVIWPMLEEAREVIRQRKHGKNVLLYLMVNMRNQVIKDQFTYKENFHGLRIKNQPFDSYPLAMSLVKHNTSLNSLIEVFKFEGNEDQLFYRRIRNRTNELGVLYHNIKDLNVTQEEANDFTKSIKKKFSWKPEIRIENIGNYYYIKEYENSSKAIVEDLLELSKCGEADYTTYVSNLIKETGYSIDSNEKKEIILKLFSSSKVACVYGAAGTGKSTLARHISYLLPDMAKCYLSNTHPAVANMYRKVGGRKSDFKTIKAYLKNPVKSDILFIDECSMINNEDMKKILELAQFKYLILLGDILQIQSIEYGTWFKLAKSFLNNNCKHELKELHRTMLPSLKTLWECVRNRENVIDEILSSYGYVKELDDNNLFSNDDRQIILCLNYDGLYGINNLNLILQGKNNNKETKIGSYVYKVNDPILFTENNRYSEVLFNNLKGKITGILDDDKYVRFLLNVETNINKMGNIVDNTLRIIKINEDNTTDIEIIVEKTFDSDKDEYISNLVPFQLAYAISIHKAQGLEYEKVKIVIGENQEEKITHDIFYTAITRATKEIEIYWTNKTQERILSSILEKDPSYDIGIFSKKFGFKIRKND